MSNVIPFKKPVETKPSKKGKSSPVTALKTNFDIFQEVQEDVLGDWQRFAAKNQLSKYIESKLSSTVRAAKGSDYVNDLNIIAGVEQKLEMKVAVFCPGCSFSNPIGWLAAFHRGKEIFSTPPDMASEGYARAMNIVLCVTFEYHMKTLGRT